MSLCQRLILRSSKWASPSLWQWNAAATSLTGVRSSLCSSSSNCRLFSVSTHVKRLSDSSATVKQQESSYVHGASSTPLLGVTIGQRIEWAANRVPDREAIVFCKRNVRLTFAQYLQQVSTSIRINSTSIYLYYQKGICSIPKYSIRSIKVSAFSCRRTKLRPDCSR